MPSSYKTSCTRPGTMLLGCGSMSMPEALFLTKIAVPPVPSFGRGLKKAVRVREVLSRRRADSAGLPCTSCCIQTVLSKRNRCSRPFFFLSLTGSAHSRAWAFHVVKLTSLTPPTRKRVGAWPGLVLPTRLLLVSISPGCFSGRSVDAELVGNLREPFDSCGAVRGVEVNLGQGLPVPGDSSISS